MFPKSDECRCIRVPNGSIIIDGLLNDDPWSGCDPVCLTLSDGSASPSRETIVRACWSEDYLYLSFDCVDNDIWGTMCAHDDPLYDEEVVEAFIDPSCNLIDYYELEMNPIGAGFDALVHNPSGRRDDMIVDIGWDCVGWRHGVHIDGRLNSRTMTDERWTVEWAIPFASLNCMTNNPPRIGDAWRVNFFRIDLTPTPEFSSWQPTMRIPADFHVPSAFGKLIFCE